MTGLRQKPRPSALNTARSVEYYTLLSRVVCDVGLYYVKGFKGEARGYWKLETGRAPWRRPKNMARVGLVNGVSITCLKWVHKTQSRAGKHCDVNSKEAVIGKRHWRHRVREVGEKQSSNSGECVITHNTIWYTIDHDGLSRNTSTGNFTLGFSFTVFSSLRRVTRKWPHCNGRIVSLFHVCSMFCFLYHLAVKLYLQTPVELGSFFFCECVKCNCHIYSIY